MSSPIQVGFVGLSSTGWAATALAPSMLQLKDKYTIKAISTSSPESASASAEKYTKDLGYPVKPYHGDTSQIARDSDVDFVVVSVKTPSHKAAVLPVIEAGKDVFLEWPAGVTLKETIEFAEAARSKGIRAIVGLQGRHSPVVAKVKELLEAGRIGKIRSTSIIALLPREIATFGPEIKERALYAIDEASGATLLNIAVGHQLDTFTHVLGEFSSVCTTTAIAYPNPIVVDDNGKPTGETRTSTVPDHIAFSGKLKSGAMVSISWRAGYSSMKGRKQLIWIIDGDDGSICLENENAHGWFIGQSEPEVYLNGELVTVDGPGGLLGNLSTVWAEFAQGEGGKYATLEDAVRIRGLLDAIERSGKEGKVVNL